LPKLVPAKQLKIFNQPTQFMLKLKIFSFCLLALGLLLLGACAEKISIAEIKANGFTPKNNNPFGSDYEVRGYLVVDPVPFLVSDAYWFGINRPIPDSAYLLLAPGSRAFKVVKTGDTGVNPQKHEGQLVSIRGNVTTVQTPYDTLSETAFETNSVTGVVSQAPCCTGGGPNIVPLCSLNQSICTLPATTYSHKFALLYSGGKEFPLNYKRYWNDLVFMYHVLRSKYGFPAENIIVVYQNGVVESSLHSQMPVNHAANLTGVTAAFDEIKYKIQNAPPSNNKLLFVFTTNHGGQDNDQQIEDEQDKSDELLFWFNQSGTQLMDDAFDNFLDGIAIIDPNITTVGLYEQCHSGGFLKDCAGPNRINIAAASETADSYGLRTRQPCMRYDAFSYFFTVALYGKYHNGSSLAISDNPDRDGDGSVSILEAYWFAAERDVACRLNETAPTHFLDDDNNSSTPHGLDVPIPTNPNSKPAPGTDGFKASTTYLN